MAQPHELDTALGYRLRQRRKALGMSQTALADAVGLTFQQIQKYERGFNRVSFSRLVEIAHALDCRVPDLIQGLDDPAEKPLEGQYSGLLSVPGAPELLTAYARISASLRRAILKLAVALAKQSSRPIDPEPEGPGRLTH